MASIDTHIKLAGVDGEATHKDHKGEIEILSWTWGVSNAQQPAPAAARARARPSPATFISPTCTTRRSPILAKYCATGKHFADATLTARKAGEGQKDFLVVKFKEVFITVGAAQRQLGRRHHRERDDELQADRLCVQGARRQGWPDR